MPVKARARWAAPACLEDLRALVAGSFHLNRYWGLVEAYDMLEPVIRFRRIAVPA